MPPPVILLAVLLVGYPLVQILAIGLRRKKRLRFNAMADALLTDPRLTGLEKTAIHAFERESRGGLRSAKALLSLPAAAFATAMKDGGRVAGPDLGHLHDDTLERLSNEAIDLKLSTLPITSAVMLPAAIVAWCIGACFALLRGAARPSPPTFHDLVRANAPLRLSPSLASRAP